MPVVADATNEADIASLGFDQAGDGVAARCIYNTGNNAPGPPSLDMEASYFEAELAHRLLSAASCSAAAKRCGAVLAARADGDPGQSRDHPVTGASAFAARLCRVGHLNS